MSYRTDIKAGEDRAAAKREVEGAVARLAKNEANRAAERDRTEAQDLYEVREAYPGAGEVWTGRHLLPVPALRWTRQVLLAAMAEERDAIALARGRAGLTWREIGQELGLAGAARRERMDLAYAAWRYAAMGVTPGQPDPDYNPYARRGPEADWRCWTCHGHIYEGHPDNGVRDAQRGHETGCGLLAKFARSERVKTYELD